MLISALRSEDNYMPKVITGRSYSTTNFASAAVCALICLIGSAALGQTTTTQGLPDEGVLRLQFGEVDRLVWETPSTSDTNPTQSISDRRILTGRTSDKCLLQLGPIGSAPSLLRFAAGVRPENQPGVVFDRIGVYGGGNDTASRGAKCMRAGASESLTLSLVGALSGRVAFHSELDIDVTQNARILATATSGGTATTWELRSGSGIVAGQGSDAPGAPIFNCPAGQEPESGPANNCRWVIDAVWDSLELRTLAGEWSLAGGSDFGVDAYANNTLFQLTQASGILDCGDTTITSGDGSETALANGRRLDNASGSACVPIPYQIESTGSDVTFLKELLGQPDAAFVFDVTWVVENATSLATIPLTVHSFDGVTYFDLDLCVGTGTFDLGGNLTSLVGVPDLDPGQPGNQYACVVSQDIDWISFQTIQLRQTIYLEGDWTAGRR